MRVTGKSQQPPRQFPPFTLSITFETQQEFEAFYTLMNAVPICAILREEGVDPDSMRELMRSHHPFDSDAKDFCNRLRRNLGIPAL